jgi:transposase
MTEQELYERLIDTQQRLIVELQIQNRELRERLRVWPRTQSEINRDAPSAQNTSAGDFSSKARSA